VELTVSPSYGRDYKSKAAALADWAAGKDFTIQTIGRDCGRQINKADADRAGITVWIRYAGMTKVVEVPRCSDCGCAK
jgi:hypothetical protein